jgi:hypothetical protein
MGHGVSLSFLLGLGSLHGIFLGDSFIHQHGVAVKILPDSAVQPIYYSDLREKAPSSSCLYPHDILHTGRGY